MSEPTEDLLDGIRTLLRTFTVDESRFPPAEGRIKYNAIDFQALHFIDQNPGSTQALLTRFLGVQPTTAQSACDRLVRRGFIDRSRHMDDRRSIVLTLTEDGASIAASIRRQDLSNCERMLEMLPSEERSHFAEQVQTIAKALSNGAPS